MQQICTCDIETSSDGELLDVNLFENDNQVYHTFESWDDWLTYLQENGEQQNITRIHAHNGGGFDWVGLAVGIMTGEIGEKQLVEIPPPVLVGGSIIKLILVFRKPEKHKKGYRVELTDSFRLLPVSLNSAAKDFLNQQKDDVPSKYIEKMELYKKRYPVKYHDYHKKDAVLLAKVLESYQNEILDLCPKLSKLPLSLGGLALKIYQLKYAKHATLSPGRDMASFEARAYKGGYTQYVGDGVKNESGAYEAVKTYDVNSMYPAIMKDNVYPYFKGKWVQSIIRDENGLILPGIYEIDYIQERGKVPILQPENEKKEKIEYSREGHGVYTYIELNELEKIGKILKVYDGLYYEKTDDLFSDYVNDIYNRRLESAEKNRKGAQLIYKLLMNNLYGKFGERDETKELKLISPSELVSRPEVEIIKNSKYGYIVVDEKIRFVKHRFPAIAAFVTGHARMMITSIINHTNVRVIYSDTDSIKTQKPLPESYIDKNKLGKFKLESENDVLHVAGKKSYMQHKPNFEQIATIKLKGVPKKSITPDLMRDVIYGSGVNFEYRSPTQIRTAIRRAIKNPNKFEKKFRFITKNKSLKEQNIFIESIDTG